MLAAYEKLGVAPLAEHTAFLEEDGVKKFSESWNALLDRVKQKASALAVPKASTSHSQTAHEEDLADHLDHRRR